MRLYLVNLRVFNDTNSIHVSVILNLPTSARHKKIVAASNLQWLNWVLRDDTKFEVVAVTPFVPEHHGVKV